jgi:YihY family inner membrane protein
MMSGLVAWLDGFQRRHAWLGFPIATLYKFFDDQGSYLAAMITYYAFVSLFPLLLLLVTILGFVLSGNPHLQQRLLHSAVTQFPVIGDQIENNVRSLHGSGLGLGVGIAGTVYGGLGVAQAVQNAMNRVWAVPRNERPNPLMSRMRSLLLLAVFGTGVIATILLSTLSTITRAFGADLGPATRIMAVAMSVLVNIGLGMLAFRLATAREVSTRDIVTGAVTAGVAWELLQILGAYYVRRKLQGASQVYGLFGIVLGLLAWIYLIALVIVFCAEINTVRRRGMWPRALLTPVTDDVELTTGDKKAYTSYAQSERFKGFEQVDVRFERDERCREPDPPKAQPGDDIDDVDMDTNREDRRR